MKYKVIKKVLLITLFLILLAYTVNITSIPESILLFKGEKLELGVIYGINLQEEKITVETSGSLNRNEILEKKVVRLKLFNIFSLKEIEVNTIPNTRVVPLGNSVRPKAICRGCYSSGTNRY